MGNGHMRPTREQTDRTENWKLRWWTVDMEDTQSLQNWERNWAIEPTTEHPSPAISTLSSGIVR